MKAFRKLCITITAVFVLLAAVLNVCLLRTDNSSGIYRYAWCLDGSGGGLSGNYGNVSYVFRVAPAFNLKKSLINHITEDGEIILKLEDAGCNNGIAESYSNVIDYVQSIVNVHDAEIKLHGCSDIPEEKVQLCRDILQLANTTVTEK